MNSILLSIKKLLGIDESYEQFDTDIIIHINSVFSILHQMGVGPETCFSISDSSALWENFVTDNKTIEMVRTYIYLKVKLIFDPPSGSSLLNAMNETIRELEWRLSVSNNL